MKKFIINFQCEEIDETNSGKKIGIVEAINFQSATKKAKRIASKNKWAIEEIFPPDIEIK